MNLLRILLALTLVLPTVSAWPCDAEQAEPAANTTETISEYPPAHHAQGAGAHVASHHGHAQSNLAELPPLETGDKADHDCCPANDPSSSCSTTPGCGQGTGASLLTVSANPVLLPNLKDHELDRLTAALLPSHSLPPFRPPSN